MATTPHSPLPASSGDVELLERLASARKDLLSQVGQKIVGQKDVLDGILTAIFSGGHALLGGVPGLAKTLMVQTVAEALELKFSRIQFTPDLMPSDITGTEIIEEDVATGKRGFRFVRGPVFATQNPIEQEGTYPLPEAQLDRFMFELRVDYPTQEEEEAIVAATTGDAGVEVRPVLTAADVLAMQHLVRRIPVSQSLVKAAVTLVRMTRPPEEASPPFIKEFISWGAGPRASQYLILGAKARAALDGRPMADEDDLRDVAPTVLTHRIVINFAAEAAGRTAPDIVGQLLKEARWQPK